jgi:hypothetical protein
MTLCKIGNGGVQNASPTAVTVITDHHCLNIAVVSGFY